MKKIILILISIALLILDNTLLPFFNINGAYPSLVFIFAVAYSLINGEKEAVFIGVLSGLLQDVYFFWGFGINALINMIICYGVAKIGDGVVREKRLVSIFAVTITSLIKHVVLFVIFYLLDINVDILRGGIIAIYSGIIITFTYGFIYKLSDVEAKKQTWRFKW